MIGMAGAIAKLGADCKFSENAANNEGSDIVTNEDQKNLHWSPPCLPSKPHASRAATARGALYVNNYFIYFAPSRA